MREAQSDTYVENKMAFLIISHNSPQSLPPAIPMEVKASLVWLLPADLGQ